VCPSWARIGGELWSEAAPEVPPVPGALQLGPWTIRYEAAGSALPIDAWAHVSSVERLLAGLVGVTPPVQVFQRITATIDGPGLNTTRTGLWLGRR
jgi:hypothetical protein